MKNMLEEELYLDVDFLFSGLLGLSCFLYLVVFSFKGQLCLEVNACNRFIGFTDAIG